MKNARFLLHLLLITALSAALYPFPLLLAIWSGSAGMDGSGDDCGAGALCMARHAVHPAAASAVCPASSLGQWRACGR